jgi:hypothetical protein
MRDNEALLLLYLMRLDADAAVLPGGYCIDSRATPTQDVAVEKLVPKSFYQQLTLHLGEHEIALSRTHCAFPGTPPSDASPRKG